MTNKSFFFLLSPAIICPSVNVQGANQTEGTCTTSTREYRTQCTFVCGIKFELSGNPTITCQLTGQWTDLPQCIGKKSFFTTNKIHGPSLSYFFFL